MNSSNVHIGCSAFNNGYWKPLFYPEGLPRNKWFEFYCEHFNTYEINATFYTFPTLKSLESWYNKTPPNFTFAVKAHKTITHFKRFNNCAEEVAAFYEIASAGLKEKLGCILFQLPPSFNYSPEKLELIISHLNPDFNNVIEFRHASWWREEVYEALSIHNITFCSVSYPNLPETVEVTSSIGYVRLHGVPKLFYSEYSDDNLKQWQNEILQSKWEKAFVYFNNTANTAGIINALYMKQLI